MCKFNLKYELVVFMIYAIVMLDLDCIPAFSDQREAFSRMQQFAEQGKIPAYVIERGIYKYVDGTRSAHVKGRNVFMRSQPLKRARIIAKLNDVDLNYLGEWTHPDNGERWVCVRKYASDEIGWIYGQYIELLKETNAKGKKMSVASNEEKKYKRNKDCAEDPCGALGGLLLISPLLYLFNIISEKKEKAEKVEKERVEQIRASQCPNYQSLQCKGCKYLGRRAFSNKSYSRCDYYEAYVNPDDSPQFNANNLLLINEKNECCPYYYLTICEKCPLIDYSDRFYKSFWCSYFKGYVEPSGMPQYNALSFR